MSNLALIVVSLIYVLALLALLWLQKRQVLGSKIASHPLTYCLALGIVGSSWSFYGANVLVSTYQANFWAIYLGLSCAFFIAPILLHPFLRVSREYQLSSLADLASFRFHNKTIGVLVSLLLVFVSLMLIQQQMQITLGAIDFLSTYPSWLTALIYSIIILSLSLFLGANRFSNQAHKKHSLIIMLAGESLLKLILVTLCGAYLYFGVLEQDVPLLITQNLDHNSWYTLLLLFFGAVIVLPHFYHILVSENLQSSALNYASWGVPVYLLVISLPLPFLYAAAHKLGLHLSSEFLPLELSQSLHNPLFNHLTYVISLTSGFGIVIVLILASVGMLLNHVLLPLHQHTSVNIYRRLKFGKYALISVIVGWSYFFYLYPLNNLWFIPYVVAIQLLPGILCSLYWQRASSFGFLGGIFGGCGAWFICFIYADNWFIALWLSVAVNCSLFGLLSLIFKPQQLELNAATICRADKYYFAQTRDLVAQSAREFSQVLRPRLGAVLALREVKTAALQLNLSLDETNPYLLTKLRTKLEQNLAKTFGQVVAHDIINECIKFTDKPHIVEKNSFSFNLIEEYLENYQAKLSGLSAEIDHLRRYQRQILQNMPLGVCSLNLKTEIILWNKAMTALTQISAEQTIGIKVANLPNPWAQLILDFLASNKRHRFKQQINGRYFNLYQANLIKQEGLVLAFEDITEMHNLEQKLIHADRLSSIGRLAAGVAHEIGNPVTAIACLAQNMADEYQEPQVIKISEQIQTQTTRVANIVQSLLNFAHAEDNLSHNLVCLRNVTAQAIDLLKLNYKNAQVVFHNNCDERHIITANEQKILQVIINLLDNARFASPAGGIIWINSTLNNNELELTVEDQGDGIDSAIIPQLFEPFFTTKKAGSGTGLGLALAYTIMQEHLGSIRIISPSDDKHQRGTKVCLTFPFNM